MTNFFAKFADGKNHERKHYADREAHFPIDVKHHREKYEKSETFLKKVGQIFREGDAGLLDVIDYRGEHSSAGIVLEKSDRLANDLGVDVIAQVGDSSVAGVLDFGHTKIFGDALGNENHNQRNAEDGPNVMNARGEK